MDIDVAPMSLDSHLTDLLMVFLGLVDGILGHSPSKVSILSQLASKEMTPGVVSICLGDYTQPVGFLVFGEAVDPNMVYTPLIPHQ